MESIPFSKLESSNWFWPILNWYCSLSSTLNGMIGNSFGFSIEILKNSSSSYYLTKQPQRFLTLYHFVIFFFLAACSSIAIYAKCMSKLSLRSKLSLFFYFFLTGDIFLMIGLASAYNVFQPIDCKL